MRTYELRYARPTGTLSLLVRMQCVNDIHALSAANGYDPEGNLRLEVWAEGDDAYPIFTTETSDAEHRPEPRAQRIRKVQSVV